MALRVFPAQEEDKREALLAAVDEVRPVLEAHAAEGETIGTLPGASVEALYNAGLFAMKLPKELGGAEADPITQLEVIEAVSRIEPSAGWCVMIGSGSIAQPAGFLPDDAIEVMFSGGRVPRAASSLAQGGTAEPVEGGYIVSGQWSFASGIRHSDWVRGGALVTGEGNESDRHLVCVIPTSQVEIVDNWHVAGLKGTGSNDFRATNLFVPESFTWNLWSPKRYRGGPMFLLGRPGFVIAGHSAFALGVARKALDVITEQASAHKRGYYNRLALSERGAFQRDLGESDLKLRASRALTVEVINEAWAEVCEGRIPGPPFQARMRATSTYVTRVATDVVTTAFRYAGGGALQETAVLQRCFRDIHAGAQHLMVSDRAYENHAQFLLGFPEANAMG